jgi:hypothetical protein
MTPGLIGAYAAALVAIIGAVFAGLAQLQHNRTMHSQSGKPYPDAPASPDSQQRP